MTVELVRLVLSVPESWDCLTDRQAGVLRRYIADPNVSRIARELGVSRQAVYHSLDLAVGKLRKFALTITDEAA